MYSSNRDIILGKQLARFYEEREMNEEKERIEQSLQREMSMQQKHQDVDFQNPTEKMIQDAESMGVNLRDAHTIAFLKKLQQESKNGSCPIKTKCGMDVNSSAFASHSHSRFRWIAQLFQGNSNAFVFGPMLFCCVLLVHKCCVLSSI